jgi:mono/diheme cytochrome c family protein
MGVTRWRWKRIFIWMIGLLVIIQLVPYGRAHTNPPVVQEPAWDAPATRDRVKASCFDCHSNETRWPAYASVAPVSWLVQYDVDAGRSHLNFSEWQRRQRHAVDAAEEVRTADMPETYYTWIHAPARLSATDRERLAQSFEKMFGKK